VVGSVLGGEVCMLLIYWVNKYFTGV
jgi:hypothetical protein